MKGSFKLYGNPRLNNSDLVQISSSLRDLHLVVAHVDVMISMRSRTTDDKFSFHYALVRKRVLFRAIRLRLSISPLPIFVSMVEVK